MSNRYRAFDGDAWLGRALPLRDGDYLMQHEKDIVTASNLEMVHAREGRKATVYRVRRTSDSVHFALKVFYRAFALPNHVEITEALQEFGDVPGLAVCRRRVIDEEEAARVGEPGLANAILMPWIEGTAWTDVIQQRLPIDLSLGVELATQAARVLAGIASRDMAHADVSSTNVIILDLGGNPSIELIDVEDMYHPEFGPIPHVPDGTAGYAHPTNTGKGCRNPHGDRYAAAILLTEMLVWHDERVRDSAADLSLFDQEELGVAGDKYDLVAKVARKVSPAAADLFDQAWHSAGLADCPSPLDWYPTLAALRASIRGSAPHPATPHPVTPNPSPPNPSPPNPADRLRLPRHQDITFEPLFTDP